MPTLFLRERAAHLLERMDQLDCDPQKLEATYRDFRVVNRLVAGWRQIYLRYLRPELRGGARTLLDIGCGGGDVLARLSAWAASDGLVLAATGLDQDERAIRHAREQSVPGLRFQVGSSAHLLRAGERFDLVISNHLLHHLSDPELLALCHDSEALARRLAVHNDIRRSDLAQLAFRASAPFFRRSFITEDGLTSIRRSFTRRELEALAPGGWRVEAAFPYRNLLVYRP